jgi:hypothetical protein
MTPNPIEKLTTLKQYALDRGWEPVGINREGKVTGAHIEPPFLKFNLETLADWQIFVALFINTKFMDAIFGDDRSSVVKALIELDSSDEQLNYVYNLVMAQIAAEQQPIEHLTYDLILKLAIEITGKNKQQIHGAGTRVANFTKRNDWLISITTDEGKEETVLDPVIIQLLTQTEDAEQFTNLARGKKYKCNNLGRVTFEALKEIAELVNKPQSSS